MKVSNEFPRHSLTMHHFLDRRVTTNLLNAFTKVRMTGYLTTSKEKDLPSKKGKLDDVGNLSCLNDITQNVRDKEVIAKKQQFLPCL